MKILYLKADSENVSVFISKDDETISSKEWKAGRELSTQILEVINNLCVIAKTSINDLDGIIVYQGPGSYTGLRISISVANALAYSLNIPVVGSSSDNWRDIGVKSFKEKSNLKLVSPIYGGDVYTTAQKK
jgi:tRNA threonylcarbamoyladenosine biosynthesis protein TsaB